MPHVVVDLDAGVPAEQMMAAATDFSERRPELWPNISRDFCTTQDSNVWQPGGTWTLTVEPRDGGSHIRMVLDRRWKGRGWLFYVPVALFGRQMFKRNLQKTLDVLASSRR